MPNFSKTLNGKGFPFDYNPGNPHYIPINVTTAPNGALFQKNGSSSFTDAYYYYEFIDTRLPTLKARLIFLKAILSSTNYGTHNGETPIWFKVMSPPQDPLSAGFEINYQTKSITLPDTMVINPVALAKDFLAQFPELRQNYGAVLQASTSNPAIKKLFSDDYVEELALSEDAIGLITLVNLLPAQGTLLYETSLEQIAHKIISMVLKQESNSFGLIEQYLNEKPEILDVLFKKSPRHIEGALNTLSFLGQQGEKLFNLFYEDIWRVLSAIDFTDYDRLKEDQSLILSKISPEGLSEALRKGRVNDNTLLSLKQLGMAPDETFVKQWLLETEYSQNWVAMGVALLEHFPQLVENINSEGLTGEKLIFVEKALTSTVPQERNAGYIYKNLPQQEQLIHSLESIRQELERLEGELTRFALYQENKDKFTVPGKGLLDSKKIEELQALKEELIQCNNLVSSIDSLLSQNGSESRQTALNNLKIMLLTGKTVATLTSLRNRAYKTLEDIETIDNTIERLAALSIKLSPRNKALTERIIQKLEELYANPDEGRKLCGHLEAYKMFTSLPEFNRISERVLSEQFKNTIQNAPLYDAMLNRLKQVHSSTRITTEVPKANKNFALLFENDFYLSLDSYYSAFAERLSHATEEERQTGLQSILDVIKAIAKTTTEEDKSIADTLEKMLTADENFQKMRTLVSQLEKESAEPLPINTPSYLNLKNAVEINKLQAALNSEEFLNKLSKLEKCLAIHQLAPSECNKAILDSLKQTALRLVNDSSPDSLAAIEKLFAQAQQIAQDFKLTEPAHLTEKQRGIYSEMVSSLASAFKGKDAATCLDYVTRKENGLQQFQAELMTRITDIEIVDTELDKPGVKGEWEKPYLQLRKELLSWPYPAVEAFPHNILNLKSMRELKSAMTRFSGHNTQLKHEVNNLFTADLTAADKASVSDASLKILDDFLNTELRTYNEAKHSGFFFKQSQERLDTIQKLHDQIKEIIATPSDESYAYRIAQALNQAEKETIQHHNQHTFKFFGKVLTSSRLANTLHQAIDHMAANGQIDDEELASLRQEENSNGIKSP